MHIYDIPERQQKILPDINPTVDYFIVTDMKRGRQGVMDEIGGRKEFGDVEWEMIMSNEHPDYDCEPLEVTIH